MPTPPEPGAPAAAADDAPSLVAAVLELSDDDLEHVVGGLERVYVQELRAAERGGVKA